MTLAYEPAIWAGLSDHAHLCSRRRPRDSSARLRTRFQGPWFLPHLPVASHHVGHVVVGPSVTATLAKGKACQVPGKGQAPHNRRSAHGWGSLPASSETHPTHARSSCCDPHAPLTQTVILERKRGRGEVSHSSERPHVTWSLERHTDHLSPEVG